MAISDPRKIRPVGQTPEPTSYDAEEDPLVELARIVSEDGGFSGRRAEKAKPRQEPQRNQRGLSADLEAELLQELESSFAEQQAPAPRPAPPPAPRPVASPPQAASVQPLPTPRTPQPQRPPVTPLRPEPAPIRETDLADTDADELLRSIEEQLGAFERRAQASRIAAEEEDAEAAFDAPVAPPDPADEWRPKHAARQRQPVEDEPAVRPVSRRQDPSAAAAGPADYRFRGPAGDRNRARHHDDEPAGEPVVLRPLSELSFGETPKARDPVAPPRPTNGAAPASDDLDPAESFVRRDRRASVEEFRREARGTVSDIKDVQFPDPAVEAGLADVEAEISRQLEPRYADPSFAGRRQAEAEEADEPRVAAVAAAREQIGRPPVRNATRRQPQQRRGGLRKGLLMAASVIVVAAVGAAAAMYMRAGEQAPSGPPPVIAAPEGAVKVEPQQEQAAAEGESVGEAVYNRVAGQANDTEEQVVDSAEEPREISRIVLPEQTANDDSVVRQVGEGAAPTATAEAPASTDDEIGPRKVQTFVVRPDGTVVTSEEAGARPDPAAAQQQQLAAQTEQIQPVPVATVAIGETASPTAPAEAATALSAPATATQDAGTGSEQALAALAPGDPVAAPAEVTAAPSEAPAATGAALPDAAASAGYVVQVSSQRSRAQAEAAYADMQNRYASVLGGLNASVQEADLGERGIYYRVRVGPWATRDEAVGVCETLRSAGGDCLVTQ
jgi:hypothetical protein